MAESIPPSLEGFTYPPLPHSSSSPHEITTSPSDVLLQHHQHLHPQQSLPTDFQFDGDVLSNSPEHPQAQDAIMSTTTPWMTPIDGFSGGSNTLNIDTSPIQKRIDGFETLNQPNPDPSFTPSMEYAPMQQQSFQPSHVLSHASSSSSLASMSSQHTDSARLLVQTFPTDITNDYHIPMEHSRQSSYSSMSMSAHIPSFDDKLFSNAPLPGMDMSVYSMPPTNLPELNHYHNAGIPTGEVFRQQPPRLALQTQNLQGMGMGMNNGMGVGKMTRERSSSRSTPYNRYRSESVSVKSEADDEIASMLSASTNYSSAPWSTTAMHPLNGGLNKITLHHRRTSSNTPYNTPINPSPIRPMLSRSRRSTAFILAKQMSQPDLQFQSQLTGVALSGSALERQETVRKDLTEKSSEIKRMTSQTQQDKARTLWVRRWLMLSYTHAPGRTVPRQGLYHSYTVSCDEYGLKPINSASFGKAVRAAFPGIKTRRLGVRGNSKYHYVSIRPDIQIEAERLNEYGDSSGAWHVVPEDGSMDFKSTSQDIDEDMDEEDLEESEEEEDPFSTSSTLKKSPSSYDFRTYTRANSGNRSRATSINDTFSARPRFLRRHTTAALGGGFNPHLEAEVPNPVFNLPGFPTIADAGHLANEQSLQDLWNSFCHHQEILVGCMRSMQFDRYEINCRTFWAGLSHQSYQIALQPAVSTMVSDAMAIAYDHMIGILLSKLSANVNITIQNGLRGLADNLETIMEESLSSFHREFSEAKVELAVRAAHLFTRFLDLRQVTFALGPILSDASQTREMIKAWSTLDIRSVSDQCALSCSCEQDILEQVLADFGQWLAEGVLANNQGRGVERLSEWIDRVLKQVMGVPGITLRAIVCRVGFITSQVMRDFTLKSEKSFGLFQLLKTFIDDYVSITSLRQTALSTKSVESNNSSSGSMPNTTGHSARSSVSSMNVFIPSPSSNDLNNSSSDLSTAVPFSTGGQLRPNNMMMDQGQYLPLPMDGMDQEGNLITPRPFGNINTSKDDQSENGSVGGEPNLMPYSS
ncbi:hypothetical protein I302_109008 [Kwoniella bestiolae CBS 10118]|uniref:RFX-type winged-helix domain-containing protein n=1 Tax=Kwoniella bestiolae CBS 10118 TaxID=1296100 RepID=A0A1B9FUQ2_9TREE|nr:hypothetical protein I302_08150 [Kwoniella bestiolae CBS 10118]OCF22500.1 hypothetical protein I302_08150 [Kwoniella bestiolae CBS 10118]